VNRWPLADGLGEISAAALTQMNGLASAFHCRLRIPNQVSI
jgi:hypothetical protein